MKLKARAFAVTCIALVSAVGLALYWFATRPRGPPCAHVLPRLCPNGALGLAVAPHCTVLCDAQSTLLQTEILWNTPLHSWTGVAAEAVAYITPLISRLPHLTLVGGFVDEYVAEYGAKLAESLRLLHGRGLNVSLAHNARAHSPAPKLAPVSIFVTQYDPGTFRDDLKRHAGDTFDYRIGRAMFETTGLPRGWVEQCSLMDEIWVPTQWSFNVFAKGGVPTSKLWVLPESVDTERFNPSKVTSNTRLMPGCDSTFGFLSIFKWEARKNPTALLEAFLQEFTASERTTLYIRSGNDEKKLQEAMTLIVNKYGLKSPPKVVWVPRVTHSEYPQLFAGAGAFVLPTHAEGWGRPIMEAMAMALPVIATNWSGPTAFMTDDNSYLLPANGTVPAYVDEPQLLNHAPQGEHAWAAIDTPTLRLIMRHVFAYRAAATQTGHRARRDIVDQFSQDVVSRAIEERLRQITARIVAHSSERAAAREKHAHTNPQDQDHE